MSETQHEFQAEVKKLLALMIHSLYSHKEVFLRELVSNASDALDRLRFAGLTEPSLLPDEDLRIELRVDPKARVLEIDDNGIGMTREEVVENIGTIARSGSQEFARSLEESRKEGGAPELIGQFGVGFYASFMVAGAVTLTTRRAGEEKATRWHSAGEGGFTIEETERPCAGTTVRLELLPADEEAGISDFCDEFVLRQTIRKYSDYVAYPITLRIEGAELSGGDGPLNSMKAIWTRPDDEVSEEEHHEFYKHISHDWSDPLLHVSTRIEGTFEARALLYIPSQAPFDLYHREMAHKGIQLYVKRVFIMDECRDLLPEWLRFVRGVVDSEDLPLNVSREMLQQDRQIRAIRKHLVKKLLEALAELRESDPDEYLGFWANFGPVLKEGLLHPDEKRERVLELLLAASTHHESRLTTLADYVARMPEDQEAIFYLTGTSREVLEGSPHLEAFRDKGYEVLLFSDPVDEVWLGQLPPEFEGHKWQSIGQGEIELGSEEERKRAEEEQRNSEEAFKGLIACLRTAVQDEVKEVRLSRRLTASPACLVLEEGDVTPQIRAMLRQAGQSVPETKPILELNPGHPLVERLQAIFEADGTDSRLPEAAQLLYGQALLAEGGQLADPAAFSRRLSDMMTRALAG